jgi:predicted RND superfamily exporter protein
MIVPLIVVLAIADDVHIMQHFEHERRHADPEQAFKRTIRHLLAPLLGASGTTALGMLSLATSNVVAVRQFGMGSAIGIMVDFAISIAFMPTLLAWMKPETTVSPHEAWLVRPMRAIARFSSGRPRRVLAIAMTALAFAIAGTPRLRVDTNHINFFAEDHPLGSSARVIDRNLAGVYSFQFFLEGPPDSMKQPDTLRRMDRLAREIARLPFVKKVTSPADYVRRIDRELNGEGAIRDDPNLIAQELFLFAMSDDGRTELERMVSTDFSKAQISVKFASMSSDLLYDEIAQAETIAAEVFARTPIRATATGSGKLFSTLDHYLVVSQLSSFATAFVTVFGVIFLVFRSARFGLLAIVPNMFPVIAVLGLMGWIGISLNIATIMVASVALGIVDDDTIHFINRFRRETAGASVDAAIETATVYEGRASLTTAFINSCAYGTVMLSAYKPTAWFGGLLALTMAVAFLAEVFVLPATIKIAPRLFAPRAVSAEAA